MGLVKGSDTGEIGGFEKFPVGEHAVMFHDLKYLVKDKETKPLEMFLVWKDLDDEFLQISHYVNFSKPKSFEGFVTALNKSGVIDKLKSQHPDTFTAGGINDDRIFEKGDDGRPVKIKEGFLGAVRNALNGTVVGIEVVDNKEYSNIKKYFSLNERKPKSGTSAPASAPTTPPPTPKTYDF